MRDDEPEVVASTEAAARGIAWDVEATDLIGLKACAEAMELTLETLSSMRAPSRSGKYAGMTTFPLPLLPGVLQRARFEMWRDPSWRPAAGETGRVWREHGVIVVPVAEDLIGLAELAEHLRITPAALRSAMSAGQRVPRRYAAVAALRFDLGARLNLWPRRRTLATPVDIEGAEGTTRGRKRTRI